ncbi:MAG TPA: M15 family metallopeptidase [Hanamia sp.]|nr:M15 family metallopeptidase [Hanamia sp.]
MLNYGWRILMTFSWVFFCTYNNAVAQSKVSNKYGLLVIKDINILQKETELNPGKRMIDLRRFIPGIVFDLKYATPDNFMHERLYPPIKTTYLRLPAATALKKVAAELDRLNLGIKIFDAYRPYSVTEKMWKVVKDDRYAADPATGSGHNRGASVDLTIIDLKTKKELPMGTGFDNFTDTAHQGFTGLPKEILKNRNVLKSVMEKYGFIALKTEWWHFYLADSANYELLDLSFAELKKLDR